MCHRTHTHTHSHTHIAHCTLAKMSANASQVEWKQKHNKQKQKPCENKTFALFYCCETTAAILFLPMWEFPHRPTDSHTHTYKIAAAPLISPLTICHFHFSLSLSLLHPFSFSRSIHPHMPCFFSLLALLFFLCEYLFLLCFLQCRFCVCYIFFIIFSNNFFLFFSVISSQNISILRRSSFDFHNHFNAWRRCRLSSLVFSGTFFMVFPHRTFFTRFSNHRRWHRQTRLQNK